MGVVHKFIKDENGSFDWEGQRFFEYGSRPDVSDGATVRWLIGAAEQSDAFAMRYFEIMAGGHSAPEDHPYEHGVLVVRGRARVVLGDEEHEVGANDVVYVPSDEHHQFINLNDDEPFGFVCVVPAHRTKKSGRQVYAESDIFTEFAPKEVRTSQ